MSAPIHPTLKRFIWDIQSMVELTEDAREILFIGADLMRRLVASDDWLPAAFAIPAADGPRQYQLFGDGAERFCVVASVLAGGQSLPVLEAPYWQILGVLRGAPALRRLALAQGTAAPADDGARRLGPGSVERFSPKGGEALQLSNPAGGETAVLIQVLGGEIGAAPRFQVAADGRLEPCVFEYANGADHPAFDIWSIQTRIED